LQHKPGFSFPIIDTDEPKYACYDTTAFAKRIVKKDFTPVIEKALELGGFDKDTTFPGINGGQTVMTGFTRNTVMSVAGTVIDAVKSGAVKHFFLVAGCDGA